MLYNKMGGYPQPTQVVKQQLACNTNGGVQGSNKRKLIILKVSNTSAETQRVTLFDAAGLAEIKEGKANSSGVIIEGLKEQYLAVLRNLNGGDQYCIGEIHTEVPAGQELQLDNDWSIFMAARFSRNRRFIDEITPSAYKDSMQQLANRLEVKEGFTLTKSTTLEFDIDAGATQIFRFFVSRAVVDM
jgi:hypothetical protein